MTITDATSWRVAPAARMTSGHDDVAARPPMARVLVVEDDASGTDPLVLLLNRAGFTTARTPAGPRALNVFDRNGADLVLLNLTCGTDMCAALRARSAVPVIIVTDRDAEIDKVVGLEVGADDYVTKPYSGRELLARIRAVLRRTAPPTGHRTELLAAGPVRMDVGRHVVTVSDGEVVLPLKEFNLLEYLLRNAGQVLTRGQLVDRVWGACYAGDTRILDAHVMRLRSKIEPDPSAPRHLVTVRGLGYKLVASATRERSGRSAVGAAKRWCGDPGCARGNGAPPTRPRVRR